MGTRGTITIIFNGKKFTVYNHYDSYPMGLGIHLINELIELLKTYTIHELIVKFNEIKVIDEDEPTSLDITKLQKFTNLTVSTQSTTDWYCLLHKCQGSIAKILESGYALQYDGHDEYNYIINFDDNNFLCKEAGWKTSLELSSLEKLCLRNSLP